MRRMLAAMLLSMLASVAAADDHKHPDDRCPKGQHEVHVERQRCTGGNVSGGGSIGKGQAGASANHQRCTTERHTVCRDNKGTAVKD